MNDFKNLLASLAPLLGTALGGPLGGVAAGFIADKLGIEGKTIDAVSKAVSQGTLTPEQVSALKLAEIDFQKFLKQNEIDLQKIASADRDSARTMQIATKSSVPATISLIVVFGYFAILVGLMFGVLHVSDNQSLLILIGALSTAFGGVLNFWLGSSHGSQSKNQLLAQSTPAK